MIKRAAIYVRVSTDKQTVENQLREVRRPTLQRFAGQLDPVFQAIVNNATRLCDDRWK